MEEIEDIGKLMSDHKELKSFLLGKYRKALTMQDVQNLKMKVKTGDGQSDVG